MVRVDAGQKSSVREAIKGSCVNRPDKHPKYLELHNPLAEGVVVEESVEGYVEVIVAQARLGMEVFLPAVVDPWDVGKDRGVVNVEVHLVRVDDHPGWRFVTAVDHIGIQESWAILSPDQLFSVGPSDHQDNQLGEPWSA